MRVLSRLFIAVWVVALGLLATPTHAQISEGIAKEASKGLHLGTGIIVLVPTDQGPLGGGLQFQGRYGIDAGPVVIAPGGQVGGFVISRRFVAIPAATLRLTVPIGFLGPFVTGGLGHGWMTHPAERGLAWNAGGGLLIHAGRYFAIGAEVNYQRIVRTEFEVLSIGPVIRFGG